MSNSQGGVWESVTVARINLVEMLAPELTPECQSRAFNLLLKNGKVQETADSYIKALSNIANRSDDVIGYVFAINGKVNSADIYGSNALFKKLWPKLLKANAIEAIAETQQDKFKPASADSVRGFLSEAEKSKRLRQGCQRACKPSDSRG